MQWLCKNIINLHIFCINNITISQQALLKYYKIIKISLKEEEKLINVLYIVLWWNTWKYMLDMYLRPSPKKFSSIVTSINGSYIKPFSETRSISIYLNHLLPFLPFFTCATPCLTSASLFFPIFGSIFFF